MEFVDTTALATALPTMSQAFAVRPEAMKLALTTYVLALAVFMPASGWLADRLGAKRVYLGALLAFSVGSLACAVSASLPELIAARALQGLGGALMTPVGRIIILRAAPRSELVSAMNWFTMPAQLGPLFGPPIAGLVLQVADWRWIFLINLPIAVLGAIAVSRFVPNERSPDIRDFDFRGYVLAASTIILFIGAVEVASMQGWSSLLAVAVSGAMVSGALYLAHARLSAHPVLDLRLFADPTFRISMIGGTLARFAVGALPLLMALLLQVGMGWTPLQAGMAMMGQAVGTLLAKASSTTLTRHFSFRQVLIGSNLAAAAMLLAPSAFTVVTPVWLVFVLMMAIGLTRSTQFTLNNTIAYADLNSSQLSSASTLASVIQQIGQALGISLAGLLLASHAISGESPGIGRFTTPLLLIGLLGATASIVYRRLPARAGDTLRGRVETDS